MNKKTLLATVVIAISSIPSQSARAAVADIYSRQCAGCHHPRRYGLSGPPLIPEYLGRRKPAELAAIIKDGLPATNMPAFRDRLTDADVSALAAYIMTPVAAPAWGDKEILSSWQEGQAPARENVPRIDLTNLFMIVEGGAGKVRFMDGDSFTMLDSISAGSIHGGPKFDKDLRYSYIVTRDGWVIKYDLVRLREVGRLRAAISSRNIAISSDSRYLAVANLLPDNITIIDASTMRPVRTIAAPGGAGAVYGLKDRKVFVAAARDSSEVLVIGDSDFALRSIRLEEPFTDFFIGPEERYLIGTSREGSKITVVDLETGAVVKSVKTDTGMPHLASAAVWRDGGSVYAAFPHIGKPVVTVLELYKWAPVREIKIKGAGFFARTHDGAPQIWVDTGTDTVQLIDKKTLEITAELVPARGKKALHAEFTKDGRYALVSVWEDEGAVNIYDTRSLKLVKSIPLKKPVGKYNATNKKF